MKTRQDKRFFHYPSSRSRQKGVLLGQVGAGQTTLLDQAALKPFDRSQIDLMLKEMPRQLTARWQGQKADLLSIALPKFASSSPSKKQPEEPLSTLLSSVRVQLKHYPSIDFILLCLKASQLPNADQANQLAPLLKLLTDHAKKPIPLHIVLTHSDQLKGFEAYFSQLSDTSKQHTWGIQFAHPPTPQAWVAASKRFLNPVQRHMLAALHFTYLWEDRQALVRFPSVMERLLDQLHLILNQCTEDNDHLAVRGVYFTSNPPHKPSLFTRRLMEKVLSRPTQPQKFTQSLASWSKKRTPWATSVVTLVLITASLMTFSYYRFISADFQSMVYAAHTSTEQPSSDTWVNSMNALQNTIHQLQRLHRHYFVFPPFRQIQQLKEQATKKYTTILADKWRPALENALLQSIKPFDNTMKPPAMLLQAKHNYRYLQAYLALQSPHRSTQQNRLLHKVVAASTFWKTQHNRADNALHHHLDQLLLASPSLALSTDSLNNKNKDVVRLVQHLLQQYPASMLIAAVAIDTLELASPSPSSNGEPISTINNAYTANTARYIDLTLAQAAAQLVKNAIIEKEVLSTSTTLEQARTYYFTHYRDYWNKQINHLTTDLTAHWLTNDDNASSPTQLIEIATHLLGQLADPQSRFYQQLNAIAQQVSPQPNQPAFNQQVSAYFKPLKELLPLLPTQEPIKEAYAYLDRLQKAEPHLQPTIGLQMAKQHIASSDPLTQLRDYAKTQPSRLSDWLEDIEILAWKGLLALSQTAMNTAWQQSVWPEYQEKIQGRYPLVKKAESTLPLSAFTHFFGHKGRLHQFYQNYMQPFIDQKGFYWVWKDVDGYHLPLSQAVLEMFMRGELIRAMYFPKGHSSPSLSFTLSPLSAVGKGHLTINDQPVGYPVKKGSPPPPLRFPWPDTVHPYLEVAFLDNQTKITLLKKAGPWAWFKWLDTGHLHRTKNLKHYIFSVTIHGHSVNYNLLTNNKLNPLSLDVIGSFRCPKTL